MDTTNTQLKSNNKETSLQKKENKAKEIKREKVHTSALVTTPEAFTRVLGNTFTLQHPGVVQLAETDKTNMVSYASVLGNQFMLQYLLSKEEDVQAQADDSEDVQTQTDDSEDVQAQADDSEDVQTQTDDSEEVQTQTDNIEDAQTQTDDSEDVQTQTDDSEDVQTQSDDSEEVQAQSDDSEDVQTQSDDSEDVQTQSDDSEEVQEKSEEVESDQENAFAGGQAKIDGLQFAAENNDEAFGGSYESDDALQRSEDNSEEVQAETDSSEDVQTKIETIIPAIPTVATPPSTPLQAMEIQQSEIEEQSETEESIASSETYQMTGASGAPDEEDSTQAKSRKSSLNVSNEVSEKIRNSRGGGDPLPEETRIEMETAFGGEDFSDVRVHTGGASTDLNKDLNAKAFTNREDIHFNSGQFNPTSQNGKHLLAHELTHVVQQRSIPDLQTKLDQGGQRDFFEKQADSMADKVIAGSTNTTKIEPVTTPSVGGGSTQLVQQKGEVVQLWGNPFKAIGNAVSSGVRAVGRGARAVGRAVVSGAETVVDTVGNVIDSAGNLIQQGVSTALNFIPGYHLLKIILGKDPITDEAVSIDVTGILRTILRFVPNGDALYEKFAAVGNAIEEAVDWFMDGLAESGLSVGYLVGIVSRLLSASSIGEAREIVTDPINRILNFAGHIVEGAKVILEKALRMLLESTEPGRQILAIIDMAGEIKEEIFEDPKRFLQNLAKGVYEGIVNFKNNIVTHIINGIFKWLTGAMGDDIEIPEEFNLKSIFSLVLQVLGLSLERVKNIAAEFLGAENVELIELLIRGDWRGAAMNLILSQRPEGDAYSGNAEARSQQEQENEDAALVDTVILKIREHAGILIEAYEAIKNDGVEGLWELIKTKVDELRNQFLTMITEILVTNLIEAAIMKLATMSNPAGAVVEVIIQIYNFLSFVWEKFSAMVGIVHGIVSSFHHLVMDAVSAAADLVEQTLGNLIPVAIDLLLRIVGLGGLSNDIRNGIERLRETVGNAITAVIQPIAEKIRPGFNAVREWIVEQKARLVRAIRRVGGSIRDAVTGAFRKNWPTFDTAIENRHQSISEDLSDEEKSRQRDGVDAVDAALQPYLRSEEVDIDEVNNVLEPLKSTHGFSVLRAVSVEGNLVVEFGFSPISAVVTEVKTGENGEDGEFDCYKVIDGDGNSVTILFDDEDSISDDDDEQKTVQIDLANYTPSSILSSVVGGTMEAKYLHKGHDRGGVPQAGAQSALMRQLPFGDNKYYRNETGDEQVELSEINPSGLKYIRGHLLNHWVGGPGEERNLFPITDSANRLHEQKAESTVKRDVEAGYLVYYKVEVDPHFVERTGYWVEGESNSGTRKELKTIDADFNITYAHYKLKENVEIDKDTKSIKADDVFTRVGTQSTKIESIFDVRQDPEDIESIRRNHGAVKATDADKIIEAEPRGAGSEYNPIALNNVGDTDSENYVNAVDAVERIDGVADREQAERIVARGRNATRYSALKGNEAIDDETIDRIKNSQKVNLSRHQSN